MWPRQLAEWFGLVVAAGGAFEILRRLVRRLRRLIRAVHGLADSIRAAGETGQAMSDFTHLFLARLIRLESRVGDLAELVVDHDADLAQLRRKDPS